MLLKTTIKRHYKISHNPALMRSHLLLRKTTNNLTRPLSTHHQQDRKTTCPKAILRIRTNQKLNLANRLAPPTEKHNIQSSPKKKVLQLLKQKLLQKLRKRRVPQNLRPILLASSDLVVARPLLMPKLQATRYV